MGPLAGIKIVELTGMGRGRCARCCSPISARRSCASTGRSRAISASSASCVFPHTGSTTYAPDAPKIPAAALSTLAADRLSTALATAVKTSATIRVALKINSQWHDDALRTTHWRNPGHGFPNEIILVGGHRHLDSWDILRGRTTTARAWSSRSRCCDSLQGPGQETTAYACAACSSPMRKMGRRGLTLT